MDQFALNRDPLDVGSNSEAASELSGSMNSCKVTNASDEFSDDTQVLRAPTLPLLPPTNTRPVSKKRDLDEWLASSSDAPLFSSDDLLASSSDLYLNEHRRKRRHRGAWYNEEQVPIKSTTQGSPPQESRRKGPFQRNMDSGVWLPSDESTGSEESERNEELTGSGEAEYSRELAIRKARIVMDMGGFMDDADDNKGPATLPWSIDVLGRASKIEDKFATAYHKATQVTEDQEGFEGLVFPYVSVTSPVK